MNIVALLSSPALAVVLVFWLCWFYRRPPAGSHPYWSANWPRSFVRGAWLYAIPGFLGIGALLCAVEFLKSVGIDTPWPFVGFPGLVFVVMCFMSVLTMAGVPMPPIFVPKWVREQDRQVREARRAARRQRRDARRRSTR